MVWTLKRLAISAFVVVHLSAVALWNLPPSALRDRLAGWTAYYILPTGQAQRWNMFAPDPLRDTIALRAVARDQYGLIHRFDFPSLAGLPPWRSVLGYRHPKYAAELNSDLAVAAREFAARHVLRTLALPASAYPVDVELYLDDWPNPTPGEPEPDPLSLPRHLTLQVYRFPTLEETQP